MESGGLSLRIEHLERDQSIAATARERQWDAINKSQQAQAVTDFQMKDVQSSVLEIKTDVKGLKRSVIATATIFLAATLALVGNLVVLLATK